MCFTYLYLCFTLFNFVTLLKPQKYVETLINHTITGRFSVLHAVTGFYNLKLATLPTRARMKHPYMRQRRNTDSQQMGGMMVAAATKVFWNKDEKRDIAAHAYRLREQNPDMSVLHAVDKAQRATLPKERRREIDTVTKVTPWLMPLWDEMKKGEQANAARGAAALFDAPGVNIDAGATVREQAPADADADAVEALQGDSATLDKETPADEPPTPQTPATEPDDRTPSSTAPREVEFDIARREPEQTTLQRQAAEQATRTAVHWTDDERRAVAAKARDNMKRWPDMKKLEAFRKANELVLPPERQRELSTWTALAAWADPMLEMLALDEQIEEQRQKEALQQRERELQAEIEDAERQAQAGIEAQRLRLEAFEAEVRARVEQMPFDALIRAFAAKIARETIGAMGEEFEKLLMGRVLDAAGIVKNRTETTPVAESAYVVPPVTRLPRVTVVGLMRQQADDVKKAFLGTIEFTFIESSKTGGKAGGGAGLTAHATTTDVAISMIDFAGHDVEEAAKKSKLPFVRISGNVSALKRWLGSWLAGDIALKCAA